MKKETKIKNIFYVAFVYLFTFTFFFCTRPPEPPTIKNESQTITITKNQPFQSNIAHIYRNSDSAEIITQPINYLQSSLVRNQTSVAFSQNQYIYEFRPILDFVGTVFVEFKSNFYYRDGTIDQIIYTKYEIIIEP